MSRAHRRWKEIIKECRRNDLVYLYGGLAIDGSFGASLADYRRLRRLRQKHLRRWEHIEREKERFFKEFRSRPYKIPLYQELEEEDRENHNV